ncbi:hypothetical protein RND81_10G226400 [Saponaria officinalis]|uniref:RING-type domain-containing protein n=1 Tax=Saponaria officinalis TaxID=3572 RepID=A0AAW1I7M0_SAPOF
MVMEIIVSVMLLFVGIVVLVVIHMCIVGRAFRRGFGGEGVLQSGIVPIFKGTGMNPLDLKKLSCVEYKVCERGTCPTDCVVCLDSFKVGDKCRVLSCDHWFHVQCVDTWLTKSALCPLCRTTVKLMAKVRDEVVDEQSTSSSMGDD